MAITEINTDQLLSDRSNIDTLVAGKVTKAATVNVRHKDAATNEMHTDIHASGGGGV